MLTLAKDDAYNWEILTVQIYIKTRQNIGFKENLRVEYYSELNFTLDISRLEIILDVALDGKMRPRRISKCTLFRGSGSYRYPETTRRREI